MLQTIHLAAKLPALPAKVYETYLSPRAHAAFTGAPVKVGARAGTPFSAFGGMLRGRILHVVPKRLIVQSWRSMGWKESEMDSTLILTLWPAGRGQTLLELLHVNVPEHDFAGVSHGWEHFYFHPWHDYLMQGRKTGAKGKSTDTM